ncbi:unnamed protein product [Closterium sp. NIES-54]
MILGSWTAAADNTCARQIAWFNGNNISTDKSDAIVNFTTWSHPPDLDSDFSPGGFWYSHTIPEAERTRALAAIQQTTAAATTTSAAAETTAAAATSAEAEATTTTPAPIASSSSTPTPVTDTTSRPAQQLTPAPRDIHRSANITAGFYSNSDLYKRFPTCTQLIC